MTETINATYLIVGAGATAIAFADTLVAETNKTAIIVDKYSRPGGHWTTAYSYVRLHQPSAYYGVNSRPLGQDAVDQVGWNKGLSELACRDEVLAYYDAVMRLTLIPSGRIQYFPKHEYLGDGSFRSILTNKTYRVGKDTRIVDATYSDVHVPSMVPPAYEVGSGVRLITPNELPSITRPYGNYTVVGAGKTGIDAVLWLLSTGIDQARITWIISRDSFFVDRAGLQTGSALLPKTRAVQKAGAESIAAAKSIDDLLERLLACGRMLRLDDNIWPTSYKCATVSVAELEQLKTIKSVVRKGRVQRIDVDQVTLNNGTYKPEADSLYIDCSACAIPKRDRVPIFQGNKITLQPVLQCQQAFSAAFISHVEAAYDSEELKNSLCQPVPLPSNPIDVAVMQIRTLQNMVQWYQQPKTFAWLRQSRLFWLRVLLPEEIDDPKMQSLILKKMREDSMAASAKLKHLLNKETVKARV